MPTAAERQALLFLAAVALIGAGVRVAGERQWRGAVLTADGAGGRRASRDGPARDGPAREGPARDGADALARQIAAVDSAQAVQAATGAKPRRARGGASRARRGSTSGAAAASDRSSAEPEQPTLSRGGQPRAPVPIDVNTATAAELERLPRVGPALAGRIVAWREAHGPFESADALRHVRGIGVTTAARLAPLVTFSPGSRPFQREARPSRRDLAPPAT